MNTRCELENLTREKTHPEDEVDSILSFFNYENSSTRKDIFYME
jgi:hypothetical protein